MTGETGRTRVPLTGGLRIDYTTEAILELGDRRWNAALDAVEEAVSAVAGIDISVDQDHLTVDVDWGSRRIVVPPKIVMVTTKADGSLMDRAAILAAIASLRKPVTP